MNRNVEPTSRGAAPSTIAGVNAQTFSVLVGASVMLTLSMGMRQSFGLFVTPVTQDIGI